MSEELFATIRARVEMCNNCDLCWDRFNTVFGDGNINANLVFVAEGPGEEEDKTGLPFVGRAGQVLNKMLKSMGMSREEVYIANIVKCRPPNNRQPSAHEVGKCIPFLWEQLGVINPKVIVTLGSTALASMLGELQKGKQIGIGKMRGKWIKIRGYNVMPTYHPAYLCRSMTDENIANVKSDLSKAKSALQEACI